MKPLILLSAIAAVALAAPQGYSAPPPPPPPAPVYSGPGVAGPGPGPVPIPIGGGCGPGEVVNVDGSCAIPDITRQVFVFTAPDQPSPQGPPPPLPPPQVEHNVIFIRAPEQAGGPEPLIVPPPQQQNIIYVLSRRPATVGGRPVIEVDAPPPTNPEVYFVNYADGENPVLPGGIDLQSALSAAAPGNGQLIGGGAGPAPGPGAPLPIGGPVAGVPLPAAGPVLDAGPGPQVGLDSLPADYTPNAIAPPTGLYSAP